MTSESRRLGPALLLALVAASLLAGLLVFRERTPDLALEVPRVQREFRLGATDERGVARLRFFVRFDEPDATVQIVGDGRVPVRTMEGVALEAGREVVCEWDGAGDDGALARPGEYRLRVVLPGQERDMVYPRRIAALPLGEDAGTPAPSDPGAPFCEPAGSGA